MQKLSTARRRRAAAPAPLKYDAGAPLAISVGELAGIGPDIILSLWLMRSEHELPPFIVFTDIDYLRARADWLGLNVPMVVCEPMAASKHFSEALPISPVPLEAEVKLRQPWAATGAHTVGSIDAAVASIFAGLCRGIVTAPIQKSVLYEAGFAFPGHTEYLAHLAEKAGHRCFPVMMLAAEEMRTVPVTIHMPLKQVAEALTTDLVLQTAMIVDRDLRQKFGIAAPRLAIAGLNPHAGENGALGSEDVEIIQPAIEMMRAFGVDATGPLPADTLFHAAAREKYDVILAMYHDQALIPIKTLAFDRGVNVTLGLPFVRTSPDHGTALDIAGTLKASPRSMLEAIKLADKMSGVQVT